MATDILSEVLGVRAILNSPLSQSPSFAEILGELEAEYQQVTNQTNNTAQSWQIDNFTLTSIIGEYDYPINPVNKDFFKALQVTTVPSDDNIDPQYVLEFVEMEHIPQEWAWLGQNRGQFMFSSHDSQIIAFYRKITDAGAQLRCQIRPTPTKVQDYNILYQVTDWWPKVNMPDTGCDHGSFEMPHSSQRFYIRALAAQNLLLKGAVRWSFDNTANFAKGQVVSSGLIARIARYKEAYEEYIDSLDQPDTTEIWSWADRNVWQGGGL